MKNYIIIFCIFMSIAGQSQNTISTAGNNIDNLNGSISYTVGQLITSTYYGNGSVLNGVQQPYEITIIDGIYEYDNLSCTIYPNPTNKFIKLITENFENLSYILYDSNGEFIESKNILNTESLINMEIYAVGVYYLLIMNTSNEVKSFKIIKN